MSDLPSYEYAKDKKDEKKLTTENADEVKNFINMLG